MGKIRIILIEDNRILREGIAATINRQPDMKVVGASGSPDKALLNSPTLKAHLILVDVSGFRTAVALARQTPERKVVGMGLMTSQVDVVEFIEQGASGFILKNATVEEFLRTIRSVARGGKVLPPLLTGSLFSHVIDHALKKGKGQLPTGVRMTKREREIMLLIAEGLSNKEIAQRLNIATYTVKSHVHNLLEKLALHNRLEIANFAIDDEAH